MKWGHYALAVTARNREEHADPERQTPAPDCWMSLPTPRLRRIGMRLARPGVTRSCCSHSPCDLALRKAPARGRQRAALVAHLDRGISAVSPRRQGADGEGVRAAANRELGGVLAALQRAGAHDRAGVRPVGRVPPAPPRDALRPRRRRGARPPAARRSRARPRVRLRARRRPHRRHRRDLRRPRLPRAPHALRRAIGSRTDHHSSQSAFVRGDGEQLPLRDRDASTWW